MSTKYSSVLNPKGKTLDVQLQSNLINLLLFEFIGNESGI